MNLTGQVQVDNIRVAQNGSRAEISFDTRIDDKVAGRNYKVVMFPVIYKGSQSMDLPPIVVENNRTRILDARRRVENLPNAFLTNNDQRLRYAITTEYKDWFNGANIRFDMTKAGCCSDKGMTSLDIAQNIDVKNLGITNVRMGGMVFILDRNSALPALYSKLQMPDAGKTITTMQTSTDRLNVLFPLLGTKIDQGLDYNGRALKMLVDALTSRENLVDKIQITGYASPEGTELQNSSLAKNRALAVRNYLIDNVKWLLPTDFEIVNGGENWEGLYKAVDASSIPGRWQVMNIISDTPNTDANTVNAPRQKQLMAINNGTVWKTLLNDMFPPLRYAVTTITAKKPVSEVIPITDAETTLRKNGDIVNKAIDLLGARDTAGALALLNQVSEDPRAWNPLGVAYLLDNNRDRAKKFFLKAIDAGYTEARSNMMQMDENDK
jgi:outer membrane protein OmpA-like peptidoglycan-associated protein